VIELVLRIGFSLLVVLALMWLLAKLARRPLRRHAGGWLTVLARQQLTRSATVTVIRVGTRTVLLGVTDHQVSLLGEVDPEPGSPSETNDPTSTRTTVHVPEPGPATVDRRDGSSWPDAPMRPGNRTLAGSLLSGRTWSQTVEFLRERTVRR
jgi:flagellar protein FliO/FliZ